jgi:glycosyltransferase involved in cell wall biosynthesis
MQKVSVIIPCYNQGEYIDDAVDSVLVQTFQDFEIIIVNDGSTDDFTNEKLKNYNKPKTKVIHTTNQRLSAARNNGINISSGEYILPLDADDKIANTYIEKAVRILNENKNIGILYCEAELFGEQSGKWDIPDFNFFDFLNDNQIFCSAFFRRDDYNKTNGYNSNMIYGLEDWDFWLSLIERGVDVFRIPETLFYYRVRNKSMLRKMDLNKKKYLQTMIVRNHPILYANKYYNPIHLHFENEEIKTKLASLSQQLETIKKSRAYKLSLILAAPVRFTKRIIRQS